MKHAPPVLADCFINWLSAVWRNVSWCHI